LRSLAGSDVVDTVGSGIMPDVKGALLKEINIFNIREKLIFHFKVGFNKIHLICM
jgi:hypothetical protein